VSSNAPGPSTVVHLAPHADDELIGAPAALMALRDTGWRVVNLTCSLGSPGDMQRRRAEVTEACRRARFELEILDEPLPDPLGTDDLAPTRTRLAAEVTARLRRLRPRLVVAPSPHDRHPGHEAVGRAALAACAAVAAGGDVAPERLWLWGLWSDLPFPTLAVAFDEARLSEILSALEGHGGELARNDYRRLVRGRAEMNASLGPERVFGFGTAGTGAPYVELLCELAPGGGDWKLGAARWLDARAPVGALTEETVGDWLAEPSLTDRFGPPG
jgi:LmbE family N-acetylglucosaminyl deacetylase